MILSSKPRTAVGTCQSAPGQSARDDHGESPVPVCPYLSERTCRYNHCGDCQLLPPPPFPDDGPSRVEHPLRKRFFSSSTKPPVSNTVAGSRPSKSRSSTSSAIPSSLFAAIPSSRLTGFFVWLTNTKFPTPSIGTLVERMTRFTILLHLPRMAATAISHGSRTDRPRWSWCRSGPRRHHPHHHHLARADSTIPDLGSRRRDGAACEPADRHGAAGLLLRPAQPLAARHQRKYQRPATPILPKGTDLAHIVPTTSQRWR